MRARARALVAAILLISGCATSGDPVSVVTGKDELDLTGPSSRRSCAESR